MAELFTFEVHTPYRLFFSGRVEAIILELTDGEIGVFANHAAFTAPCLGCILRIKDKDGVWQSAFITEGILEVKEHKTVLMVDAAERPEEINRDRALAAKQQATESLQTTMLKFDTANAKAKLRRAEYRLKACELAAGAAHA